MSGILRENMPEVRPFPAVVFPFYPDILLLPEQPLLLPETYDANQVLLSLLLYTQCSPDILL